GPGGTVATAPPVVRRRPRRQQDQPMRDMAESTARIAAIVADRSRRPSRPVHAPARPRTGVAVVACMDARLDVYRILGLAEGDAPHLPHTELVSGFLYDERTGVLDEVCRSARGI